MDRWLLPRSLDYRPISWYYSTIARLVQPTMSWWKHFKYDLQIKGTTITYTWEELKRHVRQRFVPADCMVEKVSKATTTVVTSADTKAGVGKDVVEEAEPLNGLNMQLKQVYGDTCITMERWQSWNLF
jgi:hypothetical protein